MAERSRAMKKSKLTLSIAVALTMLLSGCTPTLVTSTADKQWPNLDEKRYEKVLQETKKILDDADSKLDAQELAQRFSGTGLQMRQAIYNLANTGYKDKKFDSIPFNSTVDVVSKQKTYPRYAMFIAQSQQDKSPYAVVLNQADPRSNFKVNTWVRLFPNVKIAATNNLDKGSQIYSSDSKELSRTPDTIIKNYVAMLNADQDKAKYFRKDDFLEMIQKERQDLQESLNEIADVKFSFENTDEKPVAFALNDGSALMFTSLRYKVEILRGNHEKQGEVTGAMQALLGENSKIDSNITATYLVSLAFIVPSKLATDKQAYVVGAERVLEKVQK